MRPTAELWARVLADVPYDVAEKAMIKVLATVKYFPTVAEIREAVADLTTGRPMTAHEAWGMVTSAVKKYGYYRESEALASLPPDVVSVVKRFGWREICSCEEPDVLRGQFRRAWEASASHAREMAMLPAPIRQLIEAQSAAKALPESEPVKAIPAPVVEQDVHQDAPDNVVYMHLERIKKLLSDADADKVGESENRDVAIKMLRELATLRKAMQR